MPAPLLMALDNQKGGVQAEGPSAKLRRPERFRFWTWLDFVMLHIRKEVSWGEAPSPNQRPTCFPAGSLKRLRCRISSPCVCYCGCHSGTPSSLGFGEFWISYFWIRDAQPVIRNSPACCINLI